MAKKKTVVQISYYNNRIINVFESLTEASEKTGILKSTISAACRGNLRSSGGYQWRYRD